MFSPCREFQDRLLATDGVPAASDVSLIEHLHVCRDCDVLARRIARLSTMLRKLPRQAVPGELSGRVVAACQAGFRQDRAVALLRSTARHEVPPELERRVLEAARESRTDDPGAPRVLDRLVAEDLADPTKALARRFAGRLERLNAPGELRSRVASRSLAKRSLSHRRLTMTLVAAGLLLAIGGGVFLAQHGPRDVPQRFTFEVQHVDSLDSMEPFIRSLAAGLSGGAADAERYGKD